MLPALAFLANPAFWSGAAGATGVAGNIASLFGLGKKKGGGGGSINLEDYYPSWTKTTANTLANWVQRYLPQFQPGEAYGGKFTAGMTPFETSGLDILSKYMNAPATGELFGAGKQHILDTLGGRFARPEESPFIKSMINLSKQNLGDLINEARAKRGARGTYFTEEGLREEGRLGERTQNYLNTLIGQFIEGERGRMLESVPLAGQMEEYETTLAPLKKVGASQTLGSLQRLIEQADLEAKYQDFARQRKEAAMPLEMAPTLIQGQPGGGGIVNLPVTENNRLAQMLQQLPQLMSLFSSSFGNRANVSGMGNIPVAPANYYLRGG